MWIKPELSCRRISGLCLGSKRRPPDFFFGHSFLIRINEHTSRGYHVYDCSYIRAHAFAMFRTTWG